jgi:hypothetical protein
MKRRTCLQLAPAAILGLGRGNAAETVRLTAGPFSVSVPSEWEATAVIEKVPFHLEGPKLGFTDRPQHWALRFPAAILPRKDIGKDVNLAPQILIHKAEEWSTRFSPEIPGHDRIERLRAELDAGIAGAFPRNYPGFGDGALNFISVKKELAFQGGKGLRIVCECKYDNDFVRREGLMYLFCGLSDDNTCQVLALFPLDHPDLPTRSQKEHLGRRLGPDGELGDEFLSYQADAIQWLKALSNGFSPSLATLDGVVESLSARHWE